MAAEGAVIITYIFTGEEERDRRGRYNIPQNVTHLIFHESVTVIPAELFYEHPNIVEVYCHAGVKKIERRAFLRCPRLRRIIIPGVEIVESGAFLRCEAVTDIECPKLDRIGGGAFQGCTSLRSIIFPSAKVVEGAAFWCCEALMDVKFGKNLESIESHAFFGCPSLERITIPLKIDLIPHDNTFQGCRNLKRVNLVEGAVLRDTIAALLLEEWRIDMNEEVGSINQTLRNKALVIQEWIIGVLRKIIHYKAEHSRLLNEAATILQLTALPNDIVMNNVLPFLELPSYEFDGEDQEGEG